MFHDFGFQRLSKYSSPPAMGRHRCLRSTISFSSAKRSKGTDTVNVTPKE